MKSYNFYRIKRQIRKLSRIQTNSPKNGCGTNLTFHKKKLRSTISSGSGYGEEKNRIHHLEKNWIRVKALNIQSTDSIGSTAHSSHHWALQPSKAKQPTYLFVLNIDVVLDYGPVHGILVGEAQETEAASFLFLLNRIPPYRIIVNHNDKRKQER